MSMKLATNSLEHYWMPFTANRDFKAHPRLLVKGKGVYYWSHEGKQILDGSSGLFCCALGHGREEIARAVYEQILELDYSPPFQEAHPGQFELARLVSQLTPDGIDRVFFANSGSEAVDTAIKVALAYHRARGEGARMRFVSRERAYHGVNIGGTSLSGLVKNREAFGAGIGAVAHMRHTWLPENRFTKGQPEHGADLADDLERIVGLYGADTIAACFVEPIAGSTGALVPPKGYLERLRAICDRHGILLVFDEVICGFGRLGHPFGAQAFGVVPDIMTMAKGITNGNQPMGAVAVKGSVYDAIVESAPEGAVEFFHGYTYSGHPAACAAGIATLQIYERDRVFERAAALTPHFLDALFSLSDVPAITDIRGFGLLGGIDLASDGVPGRRGYDAHKKLYEAGLYVKMTGDAILVAPPLVCEPDHVDRMVALLRQVLSTY
ncbi:MAG: aspartate aminotransferase family protein [Ectothiorhodospiraceae bacterium]|nr:aspartate aminotransferase family protein [Chromatiales bacterium]MCP5154558.1 aspartate aminotransferase family protein [Ectothiorhodospiraceae bacterium]